MVKSIVLNEYNKNRFTKNFSAYKITGANEMNDGVYEYEGCKATLYKTGKLLLQGKNIMPFWELILTTVMKFSIDSIGSDEVGVGDFFGPMVVCAVYLSKYKINEVRNLGVADSKALKDDKIRSIAPQLQKIVEYKVTACSNRIYNQLTDRKLNSHAIKAWLHNESINYLINKCGTPDLVVVDKFAPEKSYFSYFEEFKKAFPTKCDNNVYQNIRFEEKAESKYMAVACASIIARYQWLLFMDKLSKEVGERVPFGTNDIVKSFARRVIKNKGMDFFSNNVKKHFKTYNELI